MKTDMRRLLTTAVFVATAACAGQSEPSATDPRTYNFGPLVIQPSQEITDQCVQITLNNDTPLNINAVEFTTGAGFHHSNWFYVPAGDPATNTLPLFPGADGEFTCTDRGFDQTSLIATADLRGGVLFAQSTQSQHDVQSFPPGAAIQIPAHYKLIATIHLLNATDQVITLNPTIKLTPIATSAVTTPLAGISFEDQALGLPPNKQSRFTIDCDLVGADQTPPTNWPAPSFKMYYGLAHYHALGTGMTVEGVTSDGTASTIFQTTTGIGDALGAPIDPLFDMSGYARIRVSCDYYNSTSDVVGWGNGNAEMCVFLAFTDSAYNWAGGALANDPPGDPTMVGDIATYTHPCTVYATELSTH